MIRESVDILEVMKPVYNFKASGFASPDSDYFSVKHSLYHYISMAEGNYKKYLRTEMVKAKKYFYVLRPLLAGQWILESEIAGLREKAGKLREEKKVSGEKLNEIFLKEV